MRGFVLRWMLVQHLDEPIPLELCNFHCCTTTTHDHGAERTYESREGLLLSAVFCSGVADLFVRINYLSNQPVLCKTIISKMPNKFS
jgi:hypothetical protein